MKTGSGHVLCHKILFNQIQSLSYENTTDKQPRVLPLELHESNPDLEYANGLLYLHIGSRMNFAIEFVHVGLVFKVNYTSGKWLNGCF